MEHQPLLVQMGLQTLLERAVVALQLPSVLVVKVLALGLLLLYQVYLLPVGDEVLNTRSEVFQLILEHRGQVLAALKGQHAAVLLGQDRVSVRRVSGLLNVLEELGVCVDVLAFLGGGLSILSGVLPRRG